MLPAAGVGFALARLVMVICLATGAALDAAIGPHQGKGSGELGLLRRLLEGLAAQAACNAKVDPRGLSVKHTLQLSTEWTAVLGLLRPCKISLPATPAVAGSSGLMATSARRPPNVGLSRCTGHPANTYNPPREPTCF